LFSKKNFNQDFISIVFFHTSAFLQLPEEESQAPETHLEVCAGQEEQKKFD